MILYILIVLFFLYIIMLVTTTNVIEGKPVREYCGLISSEVIVGANFIKDIFAAFSDFFGGRSNAYERALIKGKNDAMQELIEKAQKLGANAIICVDMDFEAVGKGSMFMVNISGTAVKLG